MGSSTRSLLFIPFLFVVSWAYDTPFNLDKFLQCLVASSPSPDLVSSVFYTQTNASFKSVLEATARNPRYVGESVPKPIAIVTPLSEADVQGAVICSKTCNITLRIRSGGHDYEAVSYVSRLEKLFFVIDMSKLRTIVLNMQEDTMWVQVGATLGEVYYKISEQSPTRGFPAGLCPTIGVGGHLLGGGYGAMVRKYGVAADQMIDARMVDANGKILNRRLMGEDVFWALRGGGGGSFGAVTWFKLRLVAVPEKVTVLSVTKTLEEGATNLVMKWQKFAHKAENELWLRVLISVVAKPNKNNAKKSNSGANTVQVTFQGMYLGKVDKLLQVMGSGFPELGLKNESCTEMPWINSILFFMGYPDKTPPAVMLDVTPPSPYSLEFEARSMFFDKPVPEKGLLELWDKMMTDPTAFLVWVPYGGIMPTIPENQIAFPHRNVYYLMQELNYWRDKKEDDKHIKWSSQLLRFMSKFSVIPYRAYVNYRDLDLGTNEVGNGNARINYLKAQKTWGKYYYANNFEKLVNAKMRIDPQNVFHFEQSIPPRSIARSGKSPSCGS